LPVHGISTYRFNRTYDVQVEAVEIPTDGASIEYGEHVAAIRSCMACHGDGLAGQIEFEDPTVGRIANANLTSGEGGIGAAHLESRSAQSRPHHPGKPQVLVSNQDPPSWIKYKYPFGHFDEEIYKRPGASAPPRSFSGTTPKLQPPQSTISTSQSGSSDLGENAQQFP
jgi:hypothetical protein